MKNHYLFQNSKLFVGSAVSFFLLFFLWKSSYTSFCFSLLFPLIMLLVVSYGFIELKMQERNCLKKCYFNERSFFAKLLSSHLFVTLFYIVVSIAMSVSTFMLVLDFPSLLWWYFIVHIALSSILFKSLNRLFAHTFQRQYKRLFAREWSMRLMALLLIAVFIYISLNAYIPDYLSHSLKESVLNATASVSSECIVISDVLKFGKIMEGSFWWVINESTEQMENSTVKTAIWIAFLLYNSFALLGINRFILQIIYILDGIFNKEVRA